MTCVIKLNIIYNQDPTCQECLFNYLHLNIDNIDKCIEIYFHLHQACSKFPYAIHLVFTSHNCKQQNLSKLLNFINTFPQNSLEEIWLFNLINAAYVNECYDSYFVFINKDIKDLTSKLEILSDVAKSI